MTEVLGIKGDNYCLAVKETNESMVFNGFGRLVGDSVNWSVLDCIKVSYVDILSVMSSDGVFDVYFDGKRRLCTGSGYEFVQRVRKCGVRYIGTVFHYKIGVVDGSVPVMVLVFEKGLLSREILDNFISEESLSVWENL